MQRSTSVTSPTAGAAPEVVLVTGSSGLIGSALIRELALAGAGGAARGRNAAGGAYDLVGFDREGPPHPPPSADCVEVDLASDESVRRALDDLRRQHGGRIASVVHLAAYYDFSGEPSPLYEQVTVRGTERLLRGLRGFEVDQFIFSSTMLVHAPCEPGQRIDEDWPVDPKWDYPESKVKTEQLIRALRDEVPGMRTVILRIAGVYDDACSSIPLSHQMQRILERRLTSRVYPGDLARGQAFVHLDDVVDALRLAVERRAQLPPDATLLIGEPETLSYENLQRAFGSMLHGEPWETRQIPKALAKAGAWVLDNVPLAEEPFIKPWMVDLADDHYQVDVAKPRTVLGWEPRHALERTLPKMVAALRRDPTGWYRANKLEPPPDLQELARAA